LASSAIEMYVRRSVCGVVWGSPHRHSDEEILELQPA
jgi:hypothetical protein